MNKNRSDGLVVVGVEWQEKPGNRWLLREIYDLLLRDPTEVHVGRGPDLTEEDTPLTMLLQTVADQGGEER